MKNSDSLIDYFQFAILHKGGSLDEVNDFQHVLEKYHYYYKSEFKAAGLTFRDLHDQTPQFIEYVDNYKFCPLERERGRYYSVFRQYLEEAISLKGGLDGLIHEDDLRVKFGELYRGELDCRGINVDEINEVNQPLMMFLKVLISTSKKRI